MDYESKTGLLKQVRNVGDAMHELLIIELLRYMHWKCFWETSIGDEDIELHLVVIYAVRTKEWMKKFRGDDDVKLSNFWKCSFKKPRRSELVLEASTHDSPISPSSKGGIHLLIKKEIPPEYCFPVYGKLNSAKIMEILPWFLEKINSTYFFGNGGIFKE